MKRSISLCLLSILLLAVPAVTFASCPVLTHTLSQRSKGSEVKALQMFFVGQGLLTADSATGYFGTLTLAAVQKFQTSRRIISSGTPSTTGFGAVGPKTRAAIAVSCAGGAPKATITASSTPAISHKPVINNPNCSFVPLPLAQKCAGTWKEVKDSKGCTASWQCAAK